jgi:hypothetical protein
MYPHERSLVQRLEHKPFALLGVNSDPDRAEAKRAMRREGMTWRSWWQGGTHGPISARWNVDGWPTLVILDARGVIRFRQDGHVEPRVLNRLVDHLLEETEGVRS